MGNLKLREKSNGHGGAREGAGRPKTSGHIREMLMGHAKDAVDVLSEGLKAEDVAIRQRSALEILKRVLPELRAMEPQAEKDIIENERANELYDAMSDKDYIEIEYCRRQINALNTTFLMDEGSINEHNITRLRELKNKMKTFQAKYQ